MNQSALYSSEQQDVLQKVKDPPGWNRGNPDLLVNPLPFFASYTNPAFLGSGQQGSGMMEASNQFNSAITQPRNTDRVGPAVWYSPTPPMAGLGINGGMQGAGIVDHLKKAHNFVKSRKLVSRGLHFASHFRPDLKKYANASEALGYGKQKGGSFLKKEQKGSFLKNKQKGGSFIADPKNRQIRKSKI
jgi:hypothetical protein